jgi:lysophospholipase L1-like esterase
MLGRFLPKLKVRNVRKISLYFTLFLFFLFLNYFSIFVVNKSFNNMISYIMWKQKPVSLTSNKTITKVIPKRPKTQTKKKVMLDMRDLRMDVESLKYIVFKTNLSLRSKAMLFPAPDLKNGRIIALYNPESSKKLVAWKEKMSKGQKSVIVMNGGSSSAYVPGGKPEDRFFLQLVNRYIRPKYNGTIEVVDRAHGARNSAHSAHLITSFFPDQVDLVLWEFSINDGFFPYDVRNQFILWLRNVAARQKTPPLVILVFLWTSPFKTEMSGKIFSRTFSQHSFLGAEYDFVLGHINLAAYFDSLGWGYEVTKQAFLADKHHPNALAHQILAKLLWHFISKAPQGYRPYLKRVPRRMTGLKWTCKTNTMNKRTLKRFFDQSKGIARASYTADFPRNKDGSSPLILAPLSKTNLTTLSFGRSVETRIDRQHGIVVPCCKTSSLEFDVARFGLLRGVMVTFRCTDKRKQSIRLLVNGVMYRRRPNLIRPSNWDCLLGGYNMNIGDLKSLDVDFLVLNQSMKKIGFCDSKCEPQNPIPFVSISIF